MTHIGAPASKVPDELVEDVPPVLDVLLAPDELDELAAGSPDELDVLEALLAPVVVPVPPLNCAPSSPGSVVLESRMPSTTRPHPVANSEAQTATRAPKITCLVSRLATRI